MYHGHNGLGDKVTAYSFNRASTEERTTGNVIARCFRDDTNARTVFSAFERMRIVNVNMTDCILIP